MSYKNHERVSLHLRVWTTLYDVAVQAAALKRNFFQSFLISQTTGQPLRVSQAERDLFVDFCAQHFTHLFAHAAYWINLASCLQPKLLPFVRKEIELARWLGFSHYIVHLGVAAGCENKQEGINMVARHLNELVKDSGDLTLVLENGAYGNRAIGTDLDDFALLLPKLEHPDRIWFCLDTAHAYSAGYDVRQEIEYERLMKDVAQTMGIERLALIHLNDTAEALKSYKDRHEAPGRGNIGAEGLKRIAQDPRLAHVPLLLELPPMSQEEQQNILALVEQWL
jgi:deoxyribonuclease IV